MKSRKKSRNSHCKEIAWNLQNLNCGLYDTWMNGMNCKAVRNHHCHPTGHAGEFNNSATINDDDVGVILMAVIVRMMVTLRTILTETLS